MPQMLMRSSLSLVCQRKRVIESARWCNARKRTGKQSSGKGKQSKSWFKGEPSFSGKGKSPKEPKVPKARTRATHRKLVSRVLKTRNQRQARTFRTCPTDTSWNDGWSFDEWNGYWSSVCWRERWQETGDNSASSFKFGSFDLGAMSSPKRTWTQELQ